jgi:hypothetical protein
MTAARDRQLEALRLLDSRIDPGEFKKQAKRAVVRVADRNFVSSTGIRRATRQ